MNRNIKSVRIQDFQNHEDTYFELKTGLNLFTGSSDSGKSAISRSFHLVFQDYFRKHDVRDGQKMQKLPSHFKMEIGLLALKATRMKLNIK